jgi:hypothetical protein
MTDVNQAKLSHYLAQFKDVNPGAIGGMEDPQGAVSFSEGFVEYLMQFIEDPNRPRFWKRPNVWIGAVLFLIGGSVQIGTGIFADAAMHERIMKSLMFFGQNSMTVLMVIGGMTLLGPKVKELPFIKRFTGG